MVRTKEITRKHKAHPHHIGTSGQDAVPARQYWYCTCSSILGPLCRYALPFWDHCALPLGDEYMRDAEEIFRLQNGQDQRNHENTRRTLNIRDMWAGTDFSACFWNGKKARQELQEIPEGLIQEMLHEMLDAVPAKQNWHCTLPLVFFILFVDWDGKGKSSLINRNRSNAMTWAIHPLGVSIQKIVYLDLIGQLTL